MTELSKDEGVMLAIIERLEKYRIPRALEIKEKVDQGAVLSASDMDFLERIISDAQESKHYADERPNLQGLYTRLVSLYHEIIQKGLENEQKA